MNYFGHPVPLSNRPLYQDSNFTLIFPPGALLLFCPTLIFQNLSISNPHQNGPDPTYHDSAAVGLNRGNGGQNPLGNIQFQGVNIAVNNGKVDRYFNFEDGSGKSIEKMVFNPGNLSGATQVPPNGLVQSAGFNNID